MRAALVVLDQKEQTVQSAQQLIRMAREGGIEEADREVILFCRLATEKMNSLFCGGVICYNKDHAYIDDVLRELEILQKEKRYDVFLFYGNAAGDQAAARLGLRLQGSTATQIDRINHGDQELIVVRDVYSCNLKAQLALKNRPYCLSTRKEAFSHGDGRDENGHPNIETRELRETPVPWKLIKSEQKEQQDIFEKAKIVVVGGRGIGGKEGFKKLEELADKVGGTFGATRPAVTDGWAQTGRMVGISGKIIHPMLCITCGASGAMPLVSGIQESGKIIAINDDQNALIYKVCDAGVVADWNTMVDAIIRQIECREKEEWKR